MVRIFVPESLAWKWKQRGLVLQLVLCLPRELFPLESQSFLETPLYFLDHPPSLYLEVQIALVGPPMHLILDQLR